jgi:hypothetical protein
MRINFTGASATFLIIGIIISFNSYCSTLDEKTNFKESKIQIETICDDVNNENYCTIYGATNEGKRKIFDFPSPPSHIGYNKSVFVIIFPCGTECSATFFYDPNKGLGGPFPAASVYDIERGYVLVAQSNPLKIYSIYSTSNEKPIDNIYLDIANGVTDIYSVVSDIKLIDHSFVITYVDKNGKSINLIKTVPKGQLEKPSS